MSNFALTSGISPRMRPASVAQNAEPFKMVEICVEDGALRLDDFVCRNPSVVEFFAEVSPDAREDVACHALAIGVVGLRAMGVAGHTELIEREFSKLLQTFGATLNQVRCELLDRVDATFDPEQAQSVSARLGSTIQNAHLGASRVIENAQTQLEQLIGDSFNPDLATSCVYRIGKLITETRAELDRAFDPAYEGSHLSRLSTLVDEYFGDRGTVARLVADQVTPIKAELLEAIQAVRDAVVGQAAAAQERRLSPASGDDFETEVEAMLKRLAKAYGDTVDRVGKQAGETGRSKKGDFVVQIREGGRFVVEAKDHSNHITLRGDRGILQALNASMVNRNASFAIAVAKEEGSYPKEVGAFNDYDDNKILCLFGASGQLVEAAYRWARTALLAEAARPDDLDFAALEGGIQEARLALRELGRIEGKARAIAKGADEIQALVAFQVRRANAALDQAAAGITLHVSEAS